MAASTQWRIGMNGPTGLDYGVLPGMLRMMSIPRRDWAEVFDGLRAMEQVALEAMREP